MPKPPPNKARKRPKQARSKETVEAILEGTARLLKKNGYDKMSTNRVAKVAGVSIGSLYQYFPSKEALVEELAERHIAAVTEVVVTQLAQSVDLPLREAVESLVRAMIEAHRIDPHLHRVIMAEIPKLNARQRFIEVEARLEALIQDALAERAKDIRPTNHHLASFLLFHAVEAVTHAAVLESHMLIDDDELIWEVSELVLRYLAPNDV